MVRWARSGRSRRWPSDLQIPPADLSEMLHLPRWRDAIVTHDRVAFPLHAIIGAACNAVDGPPAWAAMEWLKAAAHARSAAQAAAAVRGLAAALERAGDVATISKYLAAAVSAGTSGPTAAAHRRRQLSALARVRRVVAPHPSP